MRFLTRTRTLTLGLALAVGACASNESPGHEAAGTQAVTGAGTGGSATNAGGTSTGTLSASTGAASTSMGTSSANGSAGINASSGAVAGDAVTSSVSATGGLQSSGDVAGSGGTGSEHPATSGAPGGAGGTSNDATSCLASGPGLTTCGKDEDESCCASLPVEGGSFSRTYQNNGSGPTGKADPASVSTFLLDKYEVTVGRFRKYVEYLDGGGTPPEAGSGKHASLNDGQGLTDSGQPGSFEPGWDAAWNSRIPSGAGAAAEWAELLTTGGSPGGAGCTTYGSWTDDPGDNEMLPITCTSWYESYAFCIWDGGFLPTEAEWKYASAGGDEQRMYPWGTTAPGSNNQYAIFDCCYPEGQCSASSGRDTCTGLVNAAPVGFAELGVGRYGQIDLAGSVWEWLLDRYSNNYVTPCDDCAYLKADTNNRVLPGGGFHTGPNPYLLSSNRQSVSYDAETYRGDYAVGVRCARSP